MAQLTDTLPTIMRGEETQAPVKPAPSFFESIAGAAGDALSAIQEGNRVTAIRDKARAEAAKTGAENLAARDAAFAFLGPEDQAAAEDAANLAPQLLDLQEAGEQGRGTSPEAVSIRTQALIRARLRQFPNQAATYMKTLKEFGVIDVMTREYDQAEAAAQADEDAAQARENAIWDYGLKTLGIDVDNITDPVMKEEARQIILQDMRDGELLERRLTGSQIQSNQATVSRAQTEELDRSTSKQFTQIFLNKYEGALFTVRQGLSAILSDPSLSDAEKDEQIAAALRAVGPTADAIFSQLEVQLGTNMSPSDRTFVQGYRDRLKTSLTEMLTGSASVVASNKRQVELLQTRLQIDNIQAMPLWNELKTAIGPGAAMDAFLTEVLRNDDLTESIKREFQGVGTMKPGEGKIRINNIMEMLDGNLDIRSLSPEQSKASAPHLLGIAVNLTRNPNVQNGSDARGKEVAHNAIGNASNVAIDAVPQWGAPRLTSLIKAFTEQGVLKTLGKSGPDDAARIRTINAYQPALQRMYLALRDAPVSDQFFKKSWSADKGRWVIVPTGARPRQPSPQAIARGTAQPAENPRVSSALTEQVTQLNRAIEAQKSFARAGYDPTVKGASDAELANYYGRGIMPPSLRKDGESPVEGPKDQKKNVQSIIESALGTLSSMEFTPGEVPTDNATPEARSAVNYFTSKGWTPAQAAGIVGNLQAESGVDFSSRSTAGDGGKAMGVAQWHPDRQARFKEVMGVSVSDATLEQQLEFVDWELNNTEGAAGEALRNAQTAEEAAHIIDEMYERSSGEHRQKRVGYARGLFNG